MLKNGSTIFYLKKIQLVGERLATIFSILFLQHEYIHCQNK